MKKYLLIALGVIFSCQYPWNFISAQSVSCAELVRAVESDASSYDEVSSISLIGSEFLEEVKAYQYEDILFVIARFKREPTEIFGKKYIFCGVPEGNWRSFKYGFNGSYGQRFHQYIMDYVCNCN